MKKSIVSGIELVGSATLSFFQYIGGLAILFWEVIKWLGRGAILRVKLIIEQAAILGVNSTSIVLITTAFTGAVISLQLASQAAKFGAARFVGLGVAISMARELGPMITAVTVAGRAGSAITAELGSMKVTEQIDALEAMAVSPIKYLVVPRVVAGSFMLPILCLFAMLAGTLGGAYVAKMTANIPYKVFFDSIKDLMESQDIYKGMLKSLIFGIEISLISCYQGINTRGGAAGVGTATTGSVVFSILIVFITNFFLSAVLFPMGGKAF
ncbi:MAG: MlaE family ABC transporter permease [Vulcanimicrobiota bacterium]